MQLTVLIRTLIMYTTLTAMTLLSGCSSSDQAYRSQNPTVYTETITDGRKAIEAMLAASGAPSATVALVDGERIAWSETFGYIDKGTQTPPSTTTMFAIGSTSKVFAGMAVMKLVDLGMIDLDVPLVRYLPNFRMASPEYTQVTVRMLLNHSSGFPGGDYRNDVTYAPMPGFVDQVLATLATQRLKHAPGELATYCNDGFTLIDPLVKAVSGRSYTQFVQDEIFAPLGMTHSRFATGPFPAGSFAPRYVDDRADPQIYTNSQPAGGIYSTPEDIASVAMMLMNGGAYKGKRILSRRAVAEIGRDQTRQLRINPVPSINYGLGWDWVSYPGLAAVGVKAWAKPGGTVGYATQFIMAPEDRLAVIITGVSPTFNSSLLAERIMLHALAERGRIKAVPQPLADPPLTEKPASDADLAAISGFYADFIGVSRVEAQRDRTLTVSQYSADGNTWVETARGLKLRIDGAYSSDAGPATSYRVVQAGGRAYLARKEPTNMGHYRVDGVIGQRVAGVSPLSAAWQARLNRQWLIVNEDAQSFHLVDDSPRFTLHAVEGLPGYVLAGGVFPFLQLVDPSTRDTAAFMFLKVPMAGRDLNDVIIEVRNGEEWVRYGSALYRPRATVPELGMGEHRITIDGEGLAEWRMLGNGGSLTILGATAWKVYHDDFTGPVATGTGNGRVGDVKAGSYLLLYGAPGATITVKTIVTQ